MGMIAMPLYGSSPLARGTLSTRSLRAALPRFIPAGAGNTAMRRSASCSWAVHPRWRGEHVTHTGKVAPVTGSSPLARGTHPYLPL